MSRVRSKSTGVGGSGGGGERDGGAEDFQKLGKKEAIAWFMKFYSILRDKQEVSSRKKF